MTYNGFFSKMLSFPPNGQSENDSLIPFQTVTFLVLKAISPQNLVPVVQLTKRRFLVRVRNGQRHCYRSGTVNSKFNLIQSFFEIFATFLLFHV